MARIALGVTGSVAAIRVPALVTALRAAGHEVRVVVTEAALYFFEPAALPAGAEDAGPPLGTQFLFRDEDEWPRRGGERYRSGDPVLHIDLRRWADLLVVAPLDANTLAKFAQGLSDNLLTCLYRAWDRRHPVVLAPAMNTFMWEHPLTARHLALLLRTQNAGALAEDASLDAALAAFEAAGSLLRLCPPQSKRLACGDEGMGAMAEVDEIVEAVGEMLGRVGRVAEG